MKKLGIVLAGVAAFAIAAPVIAGGPITINELRIDQPGGDSSEYFELAGTPGASLNGLALISLGDDGGDGSGDPASRSGSVEAFVDLAGQSIPADGFFLAAEASFGTGGLGLGGSVDFTAPDINFENSENHTFLLVQGFTGAVGDLLDTDRDGFVDVTPWTSILDAVSLIENPNGAGHTPPTANETDEWDYSVDPTLNSVGVGPDGTFEPGHVFRFPNGNGGWNIGAFSGGDDTPGVANVPEPASIALLALGAVAVIRRKR